jgi:hypothetical protein
MKPLLVLLAVGAVTVMTAGAFAQSGTADPANVDPAVNRRESRDYINLVDRDAAFRAQRMHRECDPIQGDDLRRQCIDSFGASATASSGSGGTMNRTGTGNTLR